MENKTSKYFKYAIGEIVLVVIGILIALQINNWNENRKLKSKADIYVNKIINDLKVDTLNISKLINRAVTHKKEIANYFEYFNSEDSINVEQLIDSINDLEVFYLKYFPVNKTFKDMESSGNSDLLLDTHRDFLINLVSFQSELEIINQSYVDIAIEENQKSLQQLGNSTNFYKKLNRKNSKERQTQGLLHKHLFLHALDDLYRYLDIRGKKIIETSTEAIALLTEKQQ
ncbi:DUF6090 family protein [Winogradskyella helgolandensis]|uniref:DUF6090 family protein n=1 Tax=Winogradskyella helgolandensis TaxID=2697010 RepID=UPI0015CCF9FC|nr:DUF6090 family protein [Winogradskyella helgolandensis]